MRRFLPLERKLDSITKSLSMPYYNKIPKDLSKTNPSNTNTICDFMITEQKELNIKDSTIGTKIKILVWLSKHHKNKSFKEMTNRTYLNT